MIVLITEEKFLNYFLNIPVSINNLYGDPFFKVQEENTFNKLKNIAETNHKGIVSIITKSEISSDNIERLKYFNSLLNLIVLVSCSELPSSIEKVNGNRYNSLRRCVETKIPVIAYVRPFIPGLNTTKESIENMLRQIAETGCKRIVVCGLRGSDSILLNSNIEKEKLHEWSLRVKIMPPDVKAYILEFSEKYNLKIYDRTSCGVAAELGLDYSYNPYYHSPQLAGCRNCELKETCFDKQRSFIPTEEDYEFIRSLGYHPTIANENDFEICRVDPQKRKECVSCCTSCFMLKRHAIQLSDENICLGDLSLLRLLVKKLVFKKGVIDFGDKDIAKPKNPFLSDLNLYILNSWWSYSRNISSCYNCSYCIVKHYNSDKWNSFSEECGEIPFYAGKKIWIKIKGAKI